LPAGLHVVGPAFEEARILKIGAAYQHATDWHMKRPADPKGGRP
jgi:aspartyl-tRNA(Asn)/glutamyl-tRNA(Gln) amidotransferase subunit A